jgi:hypothetical protein
MTSTETVTLMPKILVSRKASKIAMVRFSARAVSVTCNQSLKETVSSEVIWN